MLKLYTYIRNGFYSRADSDRLFDKQTDDISGDRITSGTINEAQIPEINKTNLSSSVQDILEHNILFFSTLSVPSVAGSWAFRFRYTNLSDNTTVAYEVFVSTATVVRNFTLISHRRGGTIYSSTYQNGTISRGEVSGVVNGGAVIETADNTTAGQPMIALIDVINYTIEGISHTRFSAWRPVCIYL